METERLSKCGSLPHAIRAHGVLALMEIVPIFDAHENAHGRMRIHKREKEKRGLKLPPVKCAISIISSRSAEAHSMSVAENLRAQYSTINMG